MDDKFDDETEHTDKKGRRITNFQIQKKEESTEIDYMYRNRTITREFNNSKK